MSYNFSTGSLKVGDLYFENDSDGDTVIDFSEDTIDFKINNAVMVSLNTAGPQIRHSAISNVSNDTMGGGQVIYDGAGSLTAGQLYYMHTSSATWTAAKALPTGSEQALLGIALGSAVSDGLLVQGSFDVYSHLSGGFAPGKPVYLSTAAGKLQTIPPSGSGEILRLVGYCMSSTNVVWFSPSSTWIEY